MTGNFVRFQLRILRIFEISNMLFNMQEALRTYKAGIFQALGHPTRIAILEVLRDRELSSRTIQEKLGIEQANLSQHLAILRSRQIVMNRKNGNQVFYSIRNPVLVEVLDIMRLYCQNSLTDAIQMLGAAEGEASAR
jgi:ArsR family transcriptional regulator